MRPGGLPRLLDADLHRGARRDEPLLRHPDNRLVTPELTGSILEGVTRSSILELAKELGLDPEERRIPIEEWKDGVASGEIREIFACGTAAVVTPVGELRWEGGSAASTAGQDGRRGHPRHPAGPARHPVRPRRGHPRLAHPARPDLKVHRRTIPRHPRRRDTGAVAAAASPGCRTPCSGPAVGNVFETTVEQLGTAIRLGVFVAGRAAPAGAGPRRAARRLPQHPARGDRGPAGLRPGDDHGVAAEAARS